MKQTDSLVNTVYTYSTDIGLTFGIKKCGVLIMERGKVTRFDGIILPNREEIKQIEEEGYKNLGIVELDKIKEK